MTYSIQLYHNLSVIFLIRLSHSFSWLSSDFFLTMLQIEIKYTLCVSVMHIDIDG